VSPAVIGVDLGGTKVAAARLHDAVLSDSVIEPTQLSSNQALIEQLVGLVEQVRQSELDAVGIGVPSVVEFATGRVVSSVNIPLADVPLRRVLGDRIGVPV
jgi:glucokinase